MSSPTCLIYNAIFHFQVLLISSFFILTIHSYRSSPPSLLLLPQEIQDHIWGLLLGNRVVHVKWVSPAKEPPPFATRLSYHNPPKPGLYHETCMGKSQSELKTRCPMTWFHGVAHGYRSLLPAVCHPECLSSARDFDQEKSYQPYLPLLLTCKSIHAGASRVLYATNTFCFAPRGTVEAGGFPLSLFCASLSPDQSAWLRTLYLRTWTRCSQANQQVLEAYSVPAAWEDLVQDDRSGIRRLKGLTKLTLELMRVTSGNVPQTWTHAVDAFDGLKLLNLKVLHVLVWDYGIPTINRWKEERRPAFAECADGAWWDTPEYESLGRRFRQRFLGLAVEAPIDNDEADK